MSILDEHQFAEAPPSATMEDSYTYSARGSSLYADQQVDALPAQLFRYRVVKRVLDISLVLLSLPILIPIFAIIAAVMMWTSPGSVFYSHRRIRKNGAFFSMWKFRTMCINSTEVLDDYLRSHPAARAEWYANRKLRVDPRVTPVGLFLRRYSLDELPQLWNVLTGTMTLVGPRPIVAAEVEKYADKFQYYCRVKPGLTGLWQVSGRSDIGYDHRVALDCDYVKHWSLGRDLVILAKTFAVVIKQTGAV